VILHVGDTVCQVHFAHSILWLAMPPPRGVIATGRTRQRHTGPRSQITAVEGMKTLRQATKLWQEELDPEFGRSSKNIGAWLQEAKQARQCEPRAVPLYEARADLPPRGALLGGAP